jgi:hypothetical protein
MNDDPFIALLGRGRGIDPRLELPEGARGAKRMWEHAGMHCVITPNDDGEHDGWVRLPRGDTAHNRRAVVGIAHGQVVP